MSDLEQRLTDALRGAGEQAPHPGDLVTPARARLRQRRRTTAAAVIAAVVVVAIPVGVQLARQGVEPEVTTVVPDAWRTESYRDLTLRVPATWGHQGGPDWCSGDGKPAVTRGEGFLVNASCSPRFTYGVRFRDVPAQLHARPKGVPADAVLDVVGTGSASAWIVAESQEQLAQIVASGHQIDGVDANGCPAVFDPELVSVDDRVSICLFESGELQQSELLSAADSAGARTAVADAPRDEGGFVACPEYARAHPLITLRSRDLSADLLPSDCGIATRMLDESQTKLVTEDVLYWALSPGAAVGSASGLPMPDPRRD